VPAFNEVSEATCTILIDQHALRFDDVDEEIAIERSRERGATQRGLGGERLDSSPTSDATS
jgi:hypothetical protein